MKDCYHHGDLKRALIETSIHVISEEGFERLSLRRVSAQCGVSHNAVYRHFRSKEQLIEACRSYVTEQLTECLQTAADGTPPDSAERLRTLSRAYITFYTAHPTYYSFLYRNSNVCICLTLADTEGNYPPFDLFRRAYRGYAAQSGLTEQVCLTRLTQLWSMLHGLTALTISPLVNWDRDWERCLNEII